MVVFNNPTRHCFNRNLVFNVMGENYNFWNSYYDFVEKYFGWMYKKDDEFGRVRMLIVTSWVLAGFVTTLIVTRRGRKMVRSASASAYRRGKKMSASAGRTIRKYSRSKSRK